MSQAQNPYCLFFLQVSLAYLPTIPKWLEQSWNATLCHGSALILGLSRNLDFSAY